jgi:hypothetical protein
MSSIARNVEAKPPLSSLCETSAPLFTADPRRR